RTVQGENTATGFHYRKENGRRYRRSSLDECRNKAASTGETEGCHEQDRLSGKMEGLLERTCCRRQPGGECSRCAGVREPAGPAQNWQAGRQDRVLHDGADRERLLQSARKQHQLSGRHSTAAL